MPPRRRSRFQDSMTRAIKPTLGNVKVDRGGSGGGKGPKAGTVEVNFQSPGMPLAMDQDSIAFEGLAYANNVFVMRCVQTIATTISGLPFKAGLDPFDPSVYDPTAPLAQLLGPASPQAPGGPNPVTSARMLWDWSIKQYVTYGRFAWETQLDKIPGPRGRGRARDKAIVALWPLVAPYVNPIPTNGGQQMFSGYRYTTPQRDISLTPEEVFYAWKPSHDDWRQAESVLDAARLPINISVGLDKYMAQLLQNDMVATTMVVTPPFAESAGRRAFREQFRSRYTGVDNAGNTLFGEAHRAAGDTSNNPLMQVERIAQTAVEASSISISQQAKIDITIALGVPMSLIGNASQRTYANADSEYKNFWTLNVLPMISDLQDYVNTFLAPRLGMEIGWFDLSKVAALKPPALFAPPMIGDVINFGVADAAQVANVLGIPAADSTDDADTDTIDVGVESATSTSIGARSDRYGDNRRILYGITRDQLINAYVRWENRPLNTHNVEQAFGDVAGRYIERETVYLRKPKEKAAAALPTPQATIIVRNIEEGKRRHEQENRLIRSAAVRERTEAMAVQARQWIAELRAGGDEIGAYDLEEFMDEAETALVTERAELTAWDGSPDTFDDWADANADALEVLGATD